MLSFLIMFVNLSIYKDGNVGNIQKFEYLYDCFRHSSNARKYDLTINLRFFKPVTKVNDINNCRYVFDLKQIFFSGLPRYVWLEVSCDIIH